MLERVVEDQLAGELGADRHPRRVPSDPVTDEPGGVGQILAEDAGAGLRPDDVREQRALTRDVDDDVGRTNVDEFERDEVLENLPFPHTATRHAATAVKTRIPVAVHVPSKPERVE